MLSPEIWNFKPPLHHLSLFSGSSQKNSKVLTQIDNHYFNHSVTIVLPDTVLVPEDINTALTRDSVYYRVDQLPVSKLLDRNFIDAFIKSGQLTALSVETHIDTDDCAAVTPCGHLVLNLLKETYQTLGLEGKQSNFSTERYVVQINLKNPSFTPGKKNYDRAVKCLSEFVDLRMDFLVTWEPPGVKSEAGLVCPSSVAAYLSKIGCTVSTCTPQVSSSRQYGVRVPLFNTTDHHELLEWMGAVALGVDLSCEDAEGHYLSSYSGAPKTARQSQVAVLKYFGFFSNNQINRLFTVFRSYVEKRRDVPWAGVDVQGFSDSPVCWGLQEHTFHSDGDNHYTVLLCPNGTFQLFKASTFASKMKFKTS